MAVAVTTDQLEDYSMEVVVAEIVKFYFSLSYSYYCSQIVDVVVEEDVAINIKKRGSLI